MLKHLIRTALVPLLASSLTVGCAVDSEPVEDSAETGVANAKAQKLPGYLAVGASITYGVGASAAPGHVTQFKNWLEDAYFGGPIDHLNLAVPGATSQQILDDQVGRGVGFEAAHLNRGNVVSIASGGNDLLAFINSPAFYPCATGDQATCQANLGAVLQTYAANLDETFRQLTLLADDDTIVMARTQYLGFLDPGCTTTGGIDKDGNVWIGPEQVQAIIPLAFLALEGSVTDPSQADPFPGLNDIMRATAARYGATVVDVFFPFYAMQQQGADLIIRDCVHPNDDGYALLTNLFIQAFQSR